MRIETVAGYRIEAKFCHERGAYFARVTAPDGEQVVNDKIDGATTLREAWTWAVGDARAHAAAAFDKAMR